MRRLTFPLKPINGQALTAELTAAGVPLVALAPVVVSGDGLGVTLNVAEGDASQDATVTSVVAAHVPPADQTLAQVQRAAAKALFDAVDVQERLLRAACRVFAKRDEQLAGWLNTLRQRCAAAGVNVTGLPVLPVPSVADTRQAILDEVDLE